MCLKRIYSPYSSICIVHTASQLWPVQSLEKFAAQSSLKDSQSFLKWYLSGSLPSKCNAKSKGNINMNYTACWRLLIWRLTVRGWCYLACFISRSGPRSSWNKEFHRNKTSTMVETIQKTGSLQYRVLYWRLGRNVSCMQILILCIEDFLAALWNSMPRACLEL